VPFGQQSHPSRLWVVRTDGQRVTGPVSAASGPADTPSAVGGHTIMVDPCDGQRPRYDAAVPPSRLPTRGDASLRGQPGEQGRVGDAGLAPEMHHRELARAQQPGKRLWTDPQPPLCFGEGDQLRRRGELQGEVRLSRGLVRAGTRASGRRWHGEGSPLKRWVGDRSENIC
jgi:hypothetical protein